jgi:hypothetical protein
VNQETQSGPIRMVADMPPPCGPGDPHLHLRAVEIIAKPGMSSRLRTAIDGFLLGFLERQFGFSGAFLLTAHGEPRRIVVLSFWRTEEECLGNRWEFASDVQRVLEPHVDAFSRVQTFRAEISEFLGRQRPFEVDLAEPPLAGARASMD